jgi:hypothetical protein
MAGGAPSKFTPTMQKIAAAAYKYGATDAQVAEELGVSDTTIYNWKVKHPEFFATQRENKDLADSKVEKSLFERACGYSVPEEKVFCNGGEITTHMSRKHYPPETTACIFWLKNRKPDDWRDSRNVDINILTDEERVQRINALVRGVLDREVEHLTH